MLRRIPPADRAAIVQRVREIRQERHATALGQADTADLAPATDAVSATQGEPAGALSPETQLSDSAATPREAAEIQPERTEQLRRLRALRELQRQRRELRRQRLQQ